MRYHQLTTTEETHLDEVRMGQSDLDRFVMSDLANGIRMGFEAELIFSGRGGEDEEGELEPDYDADETVYSISDVANFFSDGDYNSRRDIERLNDEMFEGYIEWRGDKMREAFIDDSLELIRHYIYNHNIDYEERLEEILKEKNIDQEKIDIILNTLTNKKFQSLFQSLDSETYSIYSEARDQIEQEVTDMVDEVQPGDDTWENVWLEYEEENIDNDEFSEERWLRSEGIVHASDISGNFDIAWPYYSLSGGGENNEYNYNSALEIADDLESALNVTVKASSGYHSAKREPDLWIIEPDGSLEASMGDMPAEIISPPMELKTGLETLRKFFVWANDENAYSNKTTGFHVGVSLPTLPGRGQSVDYLKLALFLGDNYVLSKFNRSTNNYCASALEKITKDIRQGRDEATIQAALEKMRSALIQEASSTLKESGGHGKYTSINLKDDYVEFRSMGGEDYIKNLSDIENTIKRYAYAMYIASNPEVERNEYAKKLYKLLSSTQSSQDVIQLFSIYSSGLINKQSLIKQVKQIQTGRQAASNTDDKKYWWSVSPRQNPSYKIEIAATSKDQAIKNAIANEPELARLNPATDFIVTPVKPYEENKPAQQQSLPDGNQRYLVYTVDNNQPVGTFIARANDEVSARLGFRSYITSVLGRDSPAGYGFRAID
jgi:hypothetical protein